MGIKAYFDQLIGNYLFGPASGTQILIKNNAGTFAVRNAADSAYASFGANHNAGAIDGVIIGGTTQAAAHVSALQVGTSTTANYVLTADASGNATWAAAAGGSHTPSLLTRNASYSSTSTSFVDIDGTNLIITKTTSSANIMVFCMGDFSCTSIFYMNLIMDSTTYATNAHATYGLLQGYAGAITSPMIGYFTGVSAGSHTFKPRWLTTNGASYPVTNAGAGAFQQTIYMAVMEL